MRELGVQINTRYRSGELKSLFIDKSQIKAIVINEGITEGTLHTPLLLPSAPLLLPAHISLMHSDPF